MSGRGNFNIMNIAIIGNTGHLNYLFEDLHKLPECNIVAACAAGGMQPVWTLSALQKLKKPTPELFPDYRTMLDLVKVDIAVIGGPFEERAAMCKYCLERNIAVFTEKPCAITLEELSELKSVAAKHNGILYGMMGIRFEAPFYTAFRIIDSGILGAIKLIYTRKSYKIGERPEYFFHRASYGGTIPWVGIHAVDWIACCKAGNFVRVYALQHYGEKSRGTLETAAHCVFTLDSGAIASADIDYMRPAGASSHGDDRLRAVGENGVIEIAQGKVELITADGSIFPELESPELGCFGQLVRDLQTQSSNLAYETALTFKVTEAVLTAQLSADKNRELSI